MGAAGYWTALLLSLYCGQQASAISDRAGRQLVAFVFTSTRTSLSLTTLTSTVPRICIFGPNTMQTCTGRRRRKRDSKSGEAVLSRDDGPAPPPWLHPSVRPASAPVAIPGAATGAAPAAAPAAATEAGRARFLAISFTSLATVTSTFTSTTFFTDTSTTLSVSILCTVAGMSLETIYCAGG